MTPKEPTPEMRAAARDWLSKAGVQHAPPGSFWGGVAEHLAVFAATEAAQAQAEERERWRPVLGVAERIATGVYPDWSTSGGPEACAHGYAKGIPCERCDHETIAAAIREGQPKLGTAAPREAGPRKHWPDCATNHGYSDCDMGPDCGSPPPAAAGQEEGLREAALALLDWLAGYFPDSASSDEYATLAGRLAAIAGQPSAAAPVGAGNGKPQTVVATGAEHRSVITPALTAKFAAKAKQRAEEAQRKIKEPDLRPLCSAKTRRGNPCEMRAEGAGGLCIQHGLSAWNRLAKRATDEEGCDEARVHARNEEARAEELGRRLSAIDVELVTTRTERYAAIARADAAEQSASALRASLATAQRELAALRATSAPLPTPSHATLRFKSLIEAHETPCSLASDCKNIATCIGVGEDQAYFGCDEHCGHGNEDHWCEPMKHAEPEPEDAAPLSTEGAQQQTKGAKP